MIGIDLFAGAGGLSLGAMQAGIEVRMAVESNPYAAATYSWNHPHTRVYMGDIRKLKKINISKERKNTILFGGPPCQGFSTSNQKTRNLNNPGNWLFLEFFRIAKLWKPDWIVLENVTGIADTEGGIFLEQIHAKFKSLDYTVSMLVLNAVDYGVPQKRHRFFAVGSLQGISIRQPIPSVSRYVAVREAISDLPDLPNGAEFGCIPYKCSAKYNYARCMRGRQKQTTGHLVTMNTPLVVRRYKHIPQGGNWRDIPGKLMSNYADRYRCHTGIYYRLKEDEPSVVIGNYRKNMLVHPTQDRGLSVREAARLQSFPDSYEFKGSIGFQQQQVGNAVPPLLAKAVFNTIKSYCCN